MWGYGFHKQGQLGSTKEEKNFKFQQGVRPVVFEETQLEESMFE